MKPTVPAAGRLRDRKAGAFALPQADVAEPARTERLLARPFAMHRARAADDFQAIEGFTLFRVNGTTCIGRYYRLLVVLANAAFGILAGLAPLLPQGSTAALAQTSTVLMIQLGMAFVCFRFAPDADRIVSLFAGTQFLLEGASTGCLIAASVLSRGAEASQDDAAGTLGDVPTPSNDEDSRPLSLRHAAFWLGLVALSVPVLQLAEQRFVTPTLLVVRAKGMVQSPLALCAALYMLASSMPRLLHRLIATAAGLEDVDDDADGQNVDGATADAGDEAMEASAPAGLSSSANMGVGLSGDAIACAGHTVSKLLARGLAAKEAAGIELTRSLSREKDDAVRHSGRGSQTLHRSSTARTMTADETATVVEDVDSYVDGGDDL